MKMVGMWLAWAGIALSQVPAAVPDSVVPDVLEMDRAVVVRAAPEELRWFRLKNTAREARMVYLSVEVEERELPSDIDTFVAGKHYSVGQHSYVPEATQTWPGWASFRTRRLEAGQEVLVRVAGNHAEYTVRVQSYPVVERGAQQAVEMGMDFLVSLGEAWHANAPRRGAVASREILPHPEVRGCVACHPTVFTTRAYRAAREKGFADVHGAAFRRLEQRLVDNPRPMPGLEGVNWARTIFSARAVSARLQAAGADSGAYLRYARREEDEADGAAPLVSPAETALYGGAGKEFFARFVAKNVIDLNWLIVGRAEFGLPVEREVAELWKWRREDGLWPLHFDRQEAGAEFITWQALYALAKAGVREARVEELAQLCLSRQRASGEWNGPAVHKSFATPFRDTQFAVMGLSAWYGKGKVEVPRQQRRPARDAVEAYWREPSEARAEEVARRVVLSQEARERFRAQQELYSILDENEGYLATWTAQLEDEGMRRRVEEGLRERRRGTQRAVAKAWQAAKAWEAGRDREAKLALLNALWDHPQRHAGLPKDLAGRSEVVLPAYYPEYQNGVERLHERGFVYEPRVENAAFRYDARNSFYKTRVGNDSDLPDWGEAGPEIEAVLEEALRSGDAEMARSAVKALSCFPQGTTGALAVAVVDLLEGELAETVEYVFGGSGRGKLRLDGPFGWVEEKLSPALLRVLRPENAVAVRVVAASLREVTAGAPVTRDERLRGRWERLMLEAKTPAEKAERLAAGAVFPHIADGPLVRSMMLEALGSGERALEVAAVNIFVKDYVAEPTNPVLGKQFVAAARGSVRKRMVDALDPVRFTLNLSALNRYNPGRDVTLPEDANLFSSEVSQYLLREALGSEAETRQAAGELIRTYPELAGWRGQLGAEEKREPDYEYFRVRVQPLLAQPGADGRACVVCHATQTGFGLRMPGKGGFTEAQSRANYESVLRQVTVGQPKQSKILVKPTRPNDNAGDPALENATHGGGTRWGRTTEEASGSVEYETVLDWIRGARLR